MNRFMFKRSAHIFMHKDRSAKHISAADHLQQ